MCRLYAAVAQSVERILGKDEVGGSNPPSSSRISPKSLDFGDFSCRKVQNKNWSVGFSNNFSNKPAGMRWDRLS